MNTKQSILSENFIYFKDADVTDYEALSYEENMYFFDTENAPIFPDEVVEKYNLTEVEYDKLPVFMDVSKNGLLNNLLREKKMSTKIYMWMFGCNTTDKVYWGNTIQEFINFIQAIDAYRMRNGYKVVVFDIFVHNLAWDIEFFKYWFKEREFNQIRVGQDIGSKKKNKKLQNSFDITETDGTVHNARIQLEKKAVIFGKKKINYLTTIFFRDSAKITPMSLASISKDLIKVDDIYIKNSEVYQYNLVRDPDNYVPTDVESWYCYCDIYLLKEWYNQFIMEHYVRQGINPFTISQIAFDAILQKTYDDNVLRKKYHSPYDKNELTDRQIYERHFALGFIEKNPLYKEYFRLAYKGGHTTASSKYKQIASTNDNIISGVSMDITSSYPHQMTNKPLPYGKPEYHLGKYRNYEYEVEYKDGTKELRKFNYHFITIAFDGFSSIVKGNQFGLNVKLKELKEEQKVYLDCSTNESATHNVIDGQFVGSNRLKVEHKGRKELIGKFDNRFIVTVTHSEYEEWIKNFNFFHFKNGRLKKGVIFIDYVSLQSEVGHFAKGLDYFFKEKEAGDLAGNKAQTLNAKLIINSFYGKHCSRRDREQRFYDFSKDIIGFKEVTDDNINVWEDDKLFAVHYGAGVTAWGRIQLRETCRKVGSDRFIYADTDSLKFDISKEEFVQKCKDEKIDISFCKADKHLGWWDFEFEFDDFKAVGQKKYMYKKGNNWKCKCAGLPDDIRSQIDSKDKFAIGKEFIKKAKRKVIGGNLLVNISYSISDVLRN